MSEGQKIKIKPNETKNKELSQEARLVAPPMSKAQLELLHKLFYEKNLIFGRDKLFSYIRTNHPDSKISRRQIAGWLNKQEIAQIYKPHEDSKDIKSTILNKPHQQIGIDLVDMQNFEIRKNKYILNGVDLFSRKLYSIPIKNKEDKTVLTALKKIIRQVPDIKSIRSDNGAEFKNELMNKYLSNKKIKQVFSTAGNPQSNGAIERANQTLKRLIHKSIELKDGFDWVSNINKLTDNINNTIIDKINKTPNEIEKNKDDDDYTQQIKDKDIKKKKNNVAKQKFYPREMVRIYEPSDLMKSANWSDKIYKIEKVYKPRKEFTVYEYKLEGLNKKFKEEDMQKVDEVENITDQPEMFKVSKLIKPLIKDNKEHYEVSWKGYRKKSDNTIEPREQLIKDIPKMIGSFEKKNNVKWYKNGNRLRVRYDE